MIELSDEGGGEIFLQVSIVNQISFHKLFWWRMKFCLYCSGRRAPAFIEFEIIVDYPPVADESKPANLARVRGPPDGLQHSNWLRSITFLGSVTSI